MANVAWFLQSALCVYASFDTLAIFKCTRKLFLERISYGSLLCVIRCFQTKIYK